MRGFEFWGDLSVYLSVNAPVDSDSSCESCDITVQILLQNIINKLKSSQTQKKAECEADLHQFTLIINMLNSAMKLLNLHYIA